MPAENFSSGRGERLEQCRHLIRQSSGPAQPRSLSGRDSSDCGPALTAHKAAVAAFKMVAKSRWAMCGGVERGSPWGGAGGVILLGGGVEVLDATVDEGSERSGRLLDGIGLLGDGELLHELVENLDALGVLGGDLGGRHYG